MRQCGNRQRCHLATIPELMQSTYTNAHPTLEGYGLIIRVHCLSMQVHGLIMRVDGLFNLTRVDGLIMRVHVWSDHES